MTISNVKTHRDSAVPLSSMKHYSFFHVSIYWFSHRQLNKKALINPLHITTKVTDWLANIAAEPEIFLRSWWRPKQG